ncbi:bifunctional adenosylcobinamide kinase/adenosylcobinamide-phosphate guanylyltransferase [Planomonospora sp. ID67723]|uniref:bifunctional adenosylcobinamide kinase/adenosylcobinamide-phosphate guanylyltransferase n=1 Tax=Planomonospora sp. ID67723 TaxID=2738134 RepID=UPI0018C35540|nr:bifunctional adenosylcobinamide kinase/adenosylcobinamide-phosphate guanylyltransferase [Planomonospora sp. ID67723]MBG0829322.1 bifunctional adenosylcobinamide kinase/adenosylcobinamide-phosphate guanylyltransferase [Planomonospora sp. ID67723]
MKVLLEGTAGPYGWPVPGCGCSSCSRLPAAARRRPARISVDGRVLSPGGCVVASGGERLLHAPAGSVPDDVPEDVPGDAGAPFDVVLIDLLERPERLGGLRRRGLVGERTHVVAVGIDHRVPTESELERRLSLWGARAVPDGTVLDTCEPAPARPVPPRRTILLGGSRSGKSAEAELRLLAEPEVVYVATGPSGGDDPEWLARVRGHRERRPAHWETAETTEVAGLLETARSPLLIDGLGTWITAVFDECGAWEGGARARERVEARCDELVAAWRGTRARVVAVSDEVGLGVVPATSSGRAFRDALGRLNQRLVAESEDAALVVAGRLLPLPI